MKYTCIDHVLTLYPVGEINSNTAPQVEAEIFAILPNESFDQIVLDMEQVGYLSSAGLRVILKLIQKYKNIKAVNVIPDVYEVFDMTGFARLMTVEKRLVTIDVSHAQLIGEGYFSQVYRIDKDTIIKVFRRSTSIDEVRRELNLAKQAFVLGIPTAISFDVVKVGDQLGVRFEMLDCASLRDVFRDAPNRYEEMVNKYANLLRIINTTIVADTVLPSAKEDWLHKVEVDKQFLTEEQYSKLLKLADTIKERETFVHGDCHFKNIMVQGNDLLLIDMDTLSKGNPIFELAAIYAPYVAFEEDDPGNSENFLGMPASFIQPMFRHMLDIYLGGLTEEKYKKIALVSYAHMVWWNEMNSPENKVRHNGCLQRLVKLLDEVEDLDIGL